MLMNWQNQYCENGYITESNLYVQCNPYQDSNDILHWDRKFNLKIHTETQKTLNNQSNPEQKDQHWRNHNTCFQIILQSHSNKNWYKKDIKTNEIEDSDTNPCSDSHLIFNKRVPNMHRSKDSLFNKWCWENWISTYRRLKLDPNILPCSSISSSGSKM
jgi:hypothetical protein